MGDPATTAVPGFPLLAAYASHSATCAAFASNPSAPRGAAYSVQSILWSGTRNASFLEESISSLRRSYKRLSSRVQRGLLCPGVAQTLAASTTGGGGTYGAFRQCNVGEALRLFGGGVARSKIYTRSELQMACKDASNVGPWTHARYELIKIMPASWFTTDESEDMEGAIGVRLPLDMLIPKLDVLSLRDLCEVHDIFATTRHYRVELEEMLLGHQCNPDVCEDSVAVLKPYIGLERNVKHDLQSPEFARQIKQIAVEHLTGCLTAEQAASATIGFRVKQIGLDIDMQMDSDDVLVSDIPLDVLLPRLSNTALRTFGLHHKVKLLTKMKKDQCIDILKKHACQGCQPLHYVLTPVGKRVPSRQPPSWIDNGSTPFLWDSNITLSDEHYPPRPTTMHDIAVAMQGYCSDLRPEVIEESGCAVCGQLYARAQLIPFEENDYDLTCLEEVNCTRLERQSLDEPLRAAMGPVVAGSITSICAACDDALKRGRRPKMALANHLWLGEVPNCLKELTLAEMAMVTRIRYNRCVVRISSGHAKMVANVISFEHPTTKIYQRLPMGRNELEDVLAVLYTGTEPPGDDDLKRSPALVRRLKVKEALEWLKVNHRDYGDLDIDYETLESYPLSNVPVGVFYKKVDGTMGNVPDAAKSVFDTTLEDGTENGPCPYTVHGLTAERYASMTTTQRKLAAVQQLKNGGKLLAIGRDSNPQSIWSNPQLYPQMFPWLFPFGHGGVDADEHAGKLSRECHLRWLLMYHDKRFQRDASFLIVAFNHQAIRQSSRGSFMMAKRGNFKSMINTVHQLDPAVLRNISERLMNGGRAGPQTPEEQKAYRIFDQIEYVGNRVSGSMAKRKYLRGEVWSMIYFLNTPAWFITISPADSKHPLCIHWAGTDEVFKPEIKGYEERRLLITRNPVACARFFHHLMQMFIKHLCGWTDEGPHRGIFGRPAAFYGTVEQQGRMTLHLHFLLWIQGQMSLNSIREKLTKDEAFVKELTEYVESCMVGGFSTGTKDEVSARVPRDDEFENRGIHSILRPVNENVPKDYVNPTLSLPEAPPDEFCEDVERCPCENCQRCRGWYERFKTALDDILLRSNVHQCFERVDKGDGTEKTKDVEPVEQEGGRAEHAEDGAASRFKNNRSSKGDGQWRKGKRHATAKGCINKYGQCTARFPREVYMKSTVDEKTGHLNPKHTEASINDVSPPVTVGNLCNTDARFLLSGTAVKATVGYVTDYITKGWLKTYQIFSAMYDTFTRRAGVLEEDTNEPGNAARQMIMKVVNSLSAKMEIGAPMAALYLLGNPDHYTSHEFVPFYWKNYVNFVHSEWKAMETITEPALAGSETGDEREDVGLSRVERPGEDMLESEDVAALRVDDHVPIQDLQEEILGESHEDTMNGGPFSAERGREQEAVRLTREGNYYLAKSNTEDYRYRPLELESVSLYEFVQCAIKHHVRSSRAPRQDLRFFPLHEDHPQAHSHLMACDGDKRYSMIPNFLGPQLPRKDVGDREDYCATMLTLFKPWRTGIDLKAADKTWEETFGEYDFSARAQELMENFNVRYECYDARDDYAAMFKAAGNDGLDGEEDDGLWDDDMDSEEWFEDGDDDMASGVGPATQGILDANSRMFKALKDAGWSAWDKTVKGAGGVLGLPKIALDESIHSTAWRGIVKMAKLRAWRRKISAMSGKPVDATAGPRGCVRNDAFVVPSTYLSKDFEPSEKKWGEIMDGIIREFTLNEEQEKAFRVVANHACEIAPSQLLMHLGGMAGTGKSTVIRALTAFFNARKEPYRFVLMGPTGTSAALIGGSTYHSFLGLNSGSSGRGSVATMEDVRERLTGVGYLLIDEQSMLNCRDLCAISARCCDALGIYEQPFGGLNVILCGDFAQLPPAKGYSLYSRDVSLRQSPRQTIGEQENTIGKLIWLQFTTVVVLTENMRQVDDLPEEKAFQKALINLRWHACTEEDIALFRRRLAGSSPNLSVDAPGFKNVSIITARNRDKDHLNDANSSRFASEMEQGMETFYSSDTMLSAPASRDPSKRGRAYTTAKGMSQKMQTALWQQPPCTSENVAGKLSLCIGMPILIRHNEATELCMTRGQEARVVGWSSVRVPRHPKRRSLDVLYVELLKPPHTVNLPHLPKNVVPLTKISQAVDARLLNDEWVHISRSQVPVLPNFSMTDYSSQGKTRPWNVVDLTECRNFQAAYTCLSRGTRISQTLILRDFSDDKLKGELDGALRQEYRELEILATITDLRYRGVFTLEPGQSTRWSVIDAYREWKKGAGRDLDIAPLFPDDDTDISRDKDLVLEISTLKAQEKRKAQEESGRPQKKRKKTSGVMLSSVWESPAGPVWDAKDHSCAFDVWCFVLHSIWSGDKPRWSRDWGTGGGYLGSLVEHLEGMPMEDPELELTEVRDKVRQSLRNAHPDEYVQGTRGVDIVTLSRHLWGTLPIHDVTASCSRCTRQETYSSTDVQVLGPYNLVKDEMSIQAFLDESLQPLFGCEECGECTYRDNHFGGALTFQVIDAPGIYLNDRLDVGDEGVYRLAGVIYYDWEARHFLARAVGLDNKVYCYDSISGGYSDYEGVLGTTFGGERLARLRGSVASLAVYVQVNRRAMRR